MKIQNIRCNKGRLFTSLKNNQDLRTSPKSSAGSFPLATGSLSPSCWSSASTTCSEYLRQIFGRVLVEFSIWNDAENDSHLFLLPVCCQAQLNPAQLRWYLSSNSNHPPGESKQSKAKWATLVYYTIELMIHRNVYTFKPTNR